MNLDRIKSLLNNGEDIRTEFKKVSADRLPGNLFDTVCAFLNRDGGVILLGVEDNGDITGIIPEYVTKLMQDVCNQSNNPQKLSPAFILYPTVHEIDRKTIIAIEVPCSSQVHQTAGKTCDRSGDGDYAVRNPAQIAELFNQKKLRYSEEKIYPYVTIDDFEEGIFDKVRALIRSYRPQHTWLSISSDEELLKRAGLWTRDLETGREGYTLAAILLFGSETLIQNVIPHYKTDCLVKRNNIERYDDRLVLKCNLINAYDQMLEFAAKHLPDPFFMINDQRVDLREKIFRELIANILVHREFTNGLPATFIIYKDKIELKNANIPHVHGLIDINSFMPYSKNPLIANFFVQMGRVEELGSGVTISTKYLPEYMPKAQIEFIENEVFTTKITMPAILLDETEKGLVDGLVEGLVESQQKMIRLISESSNISKKSMSEKIGISTTAIDKNLKSLMKKNIIKRVGPAKGGHWEIVKK